MFSGFQRSSWFGGSAIQRNTRVGQPRNKPTMNFGMLKGAMDRNRQTGILPHKQQDLFASAPRTGQKNFTKIDDEFEDDLLNDTDEDIRNTNRLVRSPGSFLK